MAAQFMKAPYQTFKTLPSKQKGAVLLVSVVTLSLLALAGLSTVEQTVVQERTSVNAKAADDATRNADKGLKQAVTDLTNGDVFTSGFCTEDLSVEDPAMWECENISPDGYTYVVSYIMNGNEPATDDNGDTIYKVSVVGVRSGSSGGSLATQSLTAGVVVRNIATAGVWDDAIVGCRNVNLKDDTRVVGDVRTKLSTSMLDTSSGATINGDGYYVDEEDVSGSVGTLSQVDADSCDPLNLPVIFGEFETYVDDDPDYESDSKDSFGSAGDYYFNDWDDVDGETITFSAGTYNIYIKDKWDFEDVTIRINPNNSDPVALNIFVGADGQGEIDLRDVTLSAVGGGSGASVQDQISIYANFGSQSNDTSCSGGSDEVRIRDVESSGNDSTHPSNKFFGGRLYAPNATICLSGVDYKGSVWGYNVITQDYDNHDTHFEFSGDVSDDSSSTSDYALLFYTRGEIDFVAGGATACEQDDDTGSGRGSSNNGSGEASVNCDAVAEPEDDTSNNSDDTSGNNDSGNDSSERDSSGYDSSGYDSSGYDRSGRDSSGYDRDGRDSSGYDRNGYDSSGYDGSGYDGSGYDRSGYDRDGYDGSGYDRSGYDSEGYNSSGYNRSGYDRDGYNSSGYDSDGYDRTGYDRDGYNSAGFNSEGYDRDGYDSDGYNEQGYDRDGNRAGGDISIEVDRVNTEREYVDFDFGDSDLDGLTVSSIQFDAFPGDVLDKIYFGDNSNNVNIRDNDLPYTINFDSRDGAFRDSTSLRLEFENRDDVEGTYTFTITFSDGSTVTFNAQVRD